MPLDRRGQRRFKLGTNITAQVIGKNGNPVGSTISGVLKDISVGGVRFTTHNLKKDLGKKLLDATTTITFPFVTDEPISVSGQIVGADIGESDISTIRLKFSEQYSFENLDKLMDICQRLRSPDESHNILQKMEMETQTTTVANLSSIEGLMDEVARVQGKLAKESPSSRTNGKAEVPIQSNGSKAKSKKPIPEETTDTSNVDPQPTSQNKTLSKPTPTKSKKQEKPKRDSTDEKPENKIKPLEDTPNGDEKKSVSKAKEPPPQPVEIKIEPIGGSVEEAKIEIEVPSIQKPKDDQVKPVDKKVKIKNKPVSAPKKKSEKPVTQIKPDDKIAKNKPKSAPEKKSKKPVTQIASEPEVNKPEPAKSESLQPREKIAALIHEIKKDPKKMGLVQKLVDLYLSDELYEDAIKTLKIIIRINPKEAELHFLLGDIHFKAENFQECLKPLNMALRLNPKLAKAHYIFSMANELAGKEEIGQKHYRIATSLDPDIESKC